MPLKEHLDKKASEVFRGYFLNEYFSMTEDDKEALRKAINEPIPNWKPVENPLTCFPVGTQQIVVRYKGASDNVRYYLEIGHAKELWQQLLTALIKVGEFAKQDISEEDKQAMVDAAIKVKNEL